MYMNTSAAKVAVRAWESEGILLERYAYSSGQVEPIPKHAHAAYQFGLCCDHPGEYHYRGAWHQLPKGSLSIIHSGEVHAPSERTDLVAPASYWMMHADPVLLQATTSEIAEKPMGLPYFDLVVLDAEVAQVYRRFHRTVEQAASQLEQNSTLLLLLTQLISRYAQDHLVIRPLKTARPAILRVRDFLQAHYANNVSLEQLADLAELSRFHLCRAFRKEMGVSPHVYQMQVRADRAKMLLSRGMLVAEVATKTGFYDQSHFGWHFKRLVGVTPRNYLGQSNNVLDKPG